MEIKQIDTKDTYSIRNEILRPGMPIESCYFSKDNDELTFHLGVFEQSELVSIASFYFTNNDQIIDPHQFQLRGMATTNSKRGHGFSKSLLEIAFPIIKKNHVKTLWCNARIAAKGFYEKVGFESMGSKFEIDGVGTHILMYKNIS